MQKIKCIIIEDEPLAVKVLKDYIQQVPYLELTAIFKEAISAAGYLQNEETGLLFLDIHLPKLKGLDFLRTLKNPPITIVTTAFHQYALEGFELGVADYLMKPVSFKRFMAAVNKSVKLLSLNNTEIPTRDTLNDVIFLNVNRRKVKIALDDILYIESKREYVLVVTQTSEFLSKIGTNELELMLPADKFRRIHRSFIVAIYKVDTFSKENVEIRGKIIPIGRNFKNSFPVLKP